MKMVDVNLILRDRHPNVIGDKARHSSQRSSYITSILVSPVDFIAQPIIGRRRVSTAQLIQSTHPKRLDYDACRVGSTTALSLRLVLQMNPTDHHRSDK